MADRRIKGRIIRRANDEYGAIFVADNHGTRSLYFGAGILQSSIRLAQPGSLIEEHSQAIASALLFKPDPASILMIGLGGCSLVNFFLTALPDCRIDVVEIRRTVIDLALEFFLVPGADRNLRIVHAAGEEFITKEQASRYDLIIVDAFDEGGPAGPLYEKGFLDACRKRLSNDGICSLNLWAGPDDGFLARYAVIREVFESNLRLQPAGRCRNAIVLASPDPERFMNIAAYRRRAKEMRMQYGVNFPRYLSYLCWENPGI